MENRGTGLLGCLAANRISYAFDFKGPSYIMDTSCSTSFYGLINAFQDIQDGLIDNAIVASTNLNCHPHETVEFQNLGMLSSDGICKTFSSTRNGYARSEAMVSLLLQRRKNCKRIYASIVGGKVNTDGFKKEGAHYPSEESQYELIKEVYEKFNIDVNKISYLEAHGTGKYSQYFH